MKEIMEESHLDFHRRWGRLEKPYFKWQLQQFSDYIGEKIGDVGCGIGNFVEFFRAKELYLGFEPDRELAAEFELLPKGKNIKLAVNGDICASKAVEEMKNNKLDTIICINVLEHIQNDQHAISNMVKGVSNNGHICILVPAFSWLYGTFDKLGHHRRYSKKELLKITKDLNAEVIKCYYMNFLGGLGWFFKARVIKEKRPRNENYKIINLFLPIISFLEGIVKPPFGLSLVMVLKKK